MTTTHGGVPRATGTGNVERAAVVVIGGGILGVAVADALARAGTTDVVVLERDDLAAGSSGKPLGGVRAVFSDPANVELARRSLESYRALARGEGHGPGRGRGPDVGLREVGYLFALRDAADVERHAAGAGVQNALGVPTRLVDPAEAVRRCPYLDPTGLLAAVWSPDAGFARPRAVVHALARRARAAGVRFRTGAEVVAVEEGPAGQARVRLSDNSAVLAPAVVCAAGAWSGALAALAGVDLPVVPRRRQVAFAPPSPARPHAVPFTIDQSSTAYFHGSEDGGLLLGWADPAEPAGFDREVDTAWHTGLRAVLRRVAPALADVPLERGWAGLYEETPDRNALIGEATGTPFRFLYATGFSGHGFLQAPAAAECVRDLLLGRTPALDVGAFSADRFAAPVRRTEVAIV
ncbi:FAD-dependent oxidoreductase [Kineococcus aurantiacus]|uniref:Sarcosine oxidase subunit beta n=1 Tax=Kineococcus aurantiacus TaxID=37633 RepID=A0A7Y9DMF9_9ACTN|nr:sarcosine oxidase subunit beta [Kineococcus aurantiacus]